MINKHCDFCYTNKFISEGKCECGADIKVRGVLRTGGDRVVCPDCQTGMVKWKDYCIFCKRVLK
jgi:hypothetical protein